MCREIGDQVERGNSCSSTICRSSLVILQPSQSLISIVSRVQCCVHSGPTCPEGRPGGLELVALEGLASVEVKTQAFYPS